MTCDGGGGGQQAVVKLMVLLIGHQTYPDVSSFPNENILLNSGRTFGPPCSYRPDDLIFHYSPGDFTSKHP